MDYNRRTSKVRDAGSALLLEVVPMDTVLEILGILGSLATIGSFLLSLHQEYKRHRIDGEDEKRKTGGNRSS